MADHPTDRPGDTDRTTPTAPGKPGGRLVTWLAFWLGVAGSVAANAAHTAVPSDRALDAWTATGRPTDDWGPPVGAFIAAAFAPVALMLVIEVVSRVPWPVGARWAIGRWVGSAVVAAVAAVVSYWHMRGLLLSYGEPDFIADTLPLAVDGLMVVASVALMALSEAKRAARREARATAKATVQPATLPTDIPATTRPTLPPVVDQPASEPATTRRSAKATKGRTKPNGRATTQRTVEWTPTVRADVDTLRRTYPDGPTSQRQIRRDLGWHPEKATNAWWAFHSADRETGQPTDQTADDDKETTREPELVTA